jgi:hypothetical protein
MEVPLHTVLKLQPKAYSCAVTSFKLPVASCDDEITTANNTQTPESRIEITDSDALIMRNNANSQTVTMQTQTQPKHSTPTQDRQQQTEH